MNDRTASPTFELFEHVVQQLQIPVIALDPQGAVVFANTAVGAMLDMPVSEAWGQHLSDLLHLDADATAAVMAAAQSDDACEPVVAVMSCRGSPHTVSFRKLPSATSDVSSAVFFVGGAGVVGRAGRRFLIARPCHFF